MEHSPQRCPECGADWSDGNTCTDHFHMMLYWELEYLLYDVHHLMVICYHLQHPSLYSPDGLNFVKRQLVQFVEEGVTPQAMRRQISKAVDQGTRTFKIKGTAESFGSHAQPISWTFTATDVIRGGMDAYYDSVRVWASAIIRDLRMTNNL